MDNRIDSRNFSFFLDKVQTWVISLMLLTFFTPIPKNFYSYVLAVSFVLALAKYVMTPWSFKLDIRNYKPVLPFFCLYLLFFVSAFYSADIQEGLSMCGKWFSLFLIPMVFVGMGISFFTKERIRLFSTSLVIGCFIEALSKCIGLTYIFIQNPEIQTICEVSGWCKAINIFLGYQNHFVGHLIMHTTFEAMFLNMAFAVVLYNWLKGDPFFNSWWRKLLGFFVLLVFFLILSTSNSKAGQIMFAMTLVGSVIQVCMCRSYHSGFVYLSLLIAVGIPFFMTVGQGVVTRMYQSVRAINSYQQHAKLSDDGSSLPRIYCWKVALGMIKEKPLLGVGVGSRSVYRAEFSKQIEYRNIYDHPHNQFLNIMVSNGIVGLALFLWALIRAFVLVLKRRSVLWWIWLLSILLVCMTDTLFNSVYSFLFLIGGHIILEILSRGSSEEALKPFPVADDE